MVFIPPSALEGWQCAKRWDSSLKHQVNWGQGHRRLYPRLTLWGPMRVQDSECLFPPLCLWNTWAVFLWPRINQIFSILPVKSWPPLCTSKNSLVEDSQEKQNGSLLLLCSGFWLPTSHAGVSLAGKLSAMQLEPHLSPHLLYTISHRIAARISSGAVKNRDSCSTVRLFIFWQVIPTNTKFNHPVQVGGPWMIPREDMSISCCFSVSLPSSKRK